MNIRHFKINKGIAYALATAVISGVSVFMNSFAVKSFKDPYVFTTSKNLLVALALTALLTARPIRQTLGKIHGKKNWLSLIVIAAIGGSLPFLLFFKGLSLAATPVMAGFIQKTLFVWVGLLAVLFLRERPDRRQLLATLGLIGGTFLLAGPRAWHWGNAETLVGLATLLWSIEYVIAKRALKDIPVTVVVWARMALGSVILLGFLLLSGRIDALLSFSGLQWYWLGVTGVLLFGYVTCWYRALQQAEAWIVSALLVVAAPITTLLSGLFITHQLRWKDMAASLVITAAAFFILRFIRSTKPVPAAPLTLIPEIGTFHPGIVECSRYAFKPNELGYCGPDEAAGLFELTLRQRRTRGYEELLGGFQTLYPYLTFIAKQERVRDPFDPSVVEAYWLGGPVANRVSMNGFYDHLGEGLGLKKKLPRQALELLVGKVPDGAQPNHNFHVLNVFTRTGHQTLPHTVQTMDQCRISWGVVESIDKTSAVVRRARLIQSNEQIALGPEESSTVQHVWEGESLVPAFNVGDTVAIHWGWICDVLTPVQTEWLRGSTLEAIRLRNMTPYQV